MGDDDKDLKELNLNFDKDFVIEENLLGEECMIHADKVYRYGKACALMNQKRDLQKLRTQTVRSEVAHEVRKDPDGYDLIKSTESEISEAVQRDFRVKEEEEKLLEIKKEAEIVQAGRDAIHDKGRQLNNIVQLVVIGYYGAVPKVPKTLKDEAVDKASEDQQRGLKEVMGSRRKRRLDT